MSRELIGFFGRLGPWNIYHYGAIPAVVSTSLRFSRRSRVTTINLIAGHPVPSDFAVTDGNRVILVKGDRDTHKRVELFL